MRRMVGGVVAALAVAVVLPAAGCGGAARNGSDGTPRHEGSSTSAARAGVLTARGVARSKPPADAPVGPVVAGTTAFGYHLTRQLAAHAADRNLVTSPLSVSYAFGMLSAGAEGMTKAQLDKAFGYPSAGPHTAFNALSRKLVTLEPGVRVTPGPTPGPTPRSSASPAKKRKEPAPPVVGLANALWVQRGLPVGQGFLRTLASQYGAPARTVDFRSPQAAPAINQWVRGQTAGRIDKLFDRIDPAVRLVLANAVYLKADWATPFEPGQTRKLPFHKANGDVSVPMMHQEHTMGYVRGSGWQAVELPYAKGTLAMWVIVPDTAGTAGTAGEGGRPAPPPAELLAPRVLAQVASGLRSQRVDLTLPRWSFATSVDLKPELEAMGVRQAFEPHAARLEGISPQAYVSQAVHRATITVDESGTEAAAVTGIGIGVTAVPMPGVEVKADHPFAFAVVDRTTKAPLFVGQVADPSARG